MLKRYEGSCRMQLAFLTTTAVITKYATVRYASIHVCIIRYTKVSVWNLKTLVFKPQLHCFVLKLTKNTYFQTYILLWNEVALIRPCIRSVMTYYFTKLSIVPSRVIYCVTRSHLHRKRVKITLL